MLAIVATLIMTGNSTYASFPVKNQTQEKSTVDLKANENVSSAQLNQKTEKTNLSKTTAEAPQKALLDDKWITLLLWFFLGGVAAHRWYKKKPTGWNILFILTAGGCGIWALIDLINILTDNF